MKKILFIVVLLVSSICLLTSCESEAVWTPEKGQLTVWDDATGEVYSDVFKRGATPGHPNIFMLYQYSFSAPGDTPEVMSDWVRKNGELIDKMENQWRQSPYYSKEKATYIEFSCMEELSIISYYELWGRPTGEELVDMFLVKPIGPYFSFPEGDMLPDEGFSEWMTLDEWKTKACVCSAFQFKVKEPIDSPNDLVLRFSVKARNSWNSSYITRTVWVGAGQEDGIYDGGSFADAMSEEERERVEEWMSANK